MVEAYNGGAIVDSEIAALVLKDGPKFGLYHDWLYGIMDEGKKDGNDGKVSVKEFTKYMAEENYVGFTYSDVECKDMWIAFNSDDGKDDTTFEGNDDFLSHLEFRGLAKMILKCVKNG